MSDSRSRTTPGCVRDELMAEYLRVSEEMLAGQREVMLAYLRDDDPAPTASGPVRRVRTLRLLGERPAADLPAPDGAWLLVGDGPEVEELAGRLRGQGLVVRVTGAVLPETTVDVDGILLAGALSPGAPAALPDVFALVTRALKSGVRHLVALTGGEAGSDGVAGLLRAVRETWAPEPDGISVRLLDITDRSPGAPLPTDVVTHLLHPGPAEVTRWGGRWFRAEMTPQPLAGEPAASFRNAPGSTSDAASVGGSGPVGGSGDVVRVRRPGVEGGLGPVDGSGSVGATGPAGGGVPAGAADGSGPAGTAGLLAAAGLEPGRVVLVTGGFHGAAADLVRELAAAGCRVDLAGAVAPDPASAVSVSVGPGTGVSAPVGHAAGASVGRAAEMPVGAGSVSPANRAPSTAGSRRAPGLAELHAALARFGDLLPEPLDLQARRSLAGQEVGQLLDDLERSGADVVHHLLEVWDATTAARLVKTVLADRGRLDLVIHVTGMLEYERIRPEATESFARVYRGEVESARALLDVLREADPDARPRCTVMLNLDTPTDDAPADQVMAAAVGDALGRLGDRYARATGSRCLTVHWQAAPDAIGLIAELAHGERHLTQVTYTTGKATSAPD
ncbi:hypothetical protein GCM10022223_44120 [Kineosporia mesophila]|uniref:Ketoreductase (KR) domain-containing protein n=1 Tax=Kineosporia mesophila TaxID=566012 RepID=A0ABP6ZZJ7_9ACTN|nr:KR domain-containing protein [Kineosporia mesophila]MCD5348836.1 KR domain-containing protein [Kineosporia mesophila]